MEASRRAERGDRAAPAAGRRSARPPRRPGGRRRENGDPPALPPSRRVGPSVGGRNQRPVRGRQRLAVRVGGRSRPLHGVRPPRPPAGRRGTFSRTFMFSAERRVSNNDKTVKSPAPTGLGGPAAPTADLADLLWSPSPETRLTYKSDCLEQSLRRLRVSERNRSETPPPLAGGGVPSPSSDLPENRQSTARPGERSRVLDRRERRAPSAPRRESGGAAGSGGLPPTRKPGRTSEAERSENDRRGRSR